MTITLDKTTTADLLVELGSPLRVYKKEDERMRIHGGIENEDDDEEGCGKSLSAPRSKGGRGEEKNLFSFPKPNAHVAPLFFFFFFAVFWNYFQYGMDFLISPITHVVCKIVLHSNLPGSILFGRWERCPWEIEPARPGDIDLGQSVRMCT